MEYKNNTKNEKQIQEIHIGIDEAGRGPVIGPMVISSFSTLKKNIETLEKLGVKDSKQLTSKKRQELFNQITELKESEWCNFKSIIIPPSEIDEALNNPFLNLNKLETIKAIDLISKNIQKTEKKQKQSNQIKTIFKIYIDCPSNNIKSFITEFFSFFNQEYEIEEKDKDLTIAYSNIKNHELVLYFAHKADDKYKVVSAASIIAKVTRDKLINNIKKQIGIDFGSGYPSDPKTQKFLKKYYNKFNIFRKTWQSWKKVNQSTLDNFK